MMPTTKPAQKGAILRCNRGKASPRQPNSSSVPRKKADSKATTDSVASDFLKKVAAAKGEGYPGLGEGEDIRLSANELAGGALVVEERVVHLAAFNRDPEGRVVRRRPSRWFSEE